MDEAFKQKLSAPVHSTLLYDFDMKEFFCVFGRTFHSENHGLISILLPLVGIEPREPPSAKVGSTIQPSVAKFTWSPMVPVKAFPMSKSGIVVCSIIKAKL